MNHLFESLALTLLNRLLIWAILKAYRYGECTICHQRLPWGDKCELCEDCQNGLFKLTKGRFPL